MPTSSRCLVVVLLAILLAGCGGGGSAPVAHTDRVTMGTLQVSHDVLQEAGAHSGLDSGATEMILTLLDARGRPVPGGTLRTRRVDLVEFQVRPTAGTLHIQYVRPASLRDETVGTTRVPVTVGADQVTRVTLDGNPAAPVHFAQSGTQWYFVVNGNSVTMKGVGFDYALGTDSPTVSDTNWFAYVNPQIAQAGANTIRTYGVGWNFWTPQQQAANLSALLAFAKANSTSTNRIMVLGGLVYDTGQGDMTTLIPQTTALVQADPNYDHFLGWVIGNERPVSDYPGINSVIAQVKAGMTSTALVRPVTTVTPVVSSGQVGVIKSQLPNIDWLGINNFYGQYDATHAGGGFLDTQADDLATGGWTNPWGITEYYSYDLPSPPFGSNPGMPNQTLNGTRYFLELNSTLNAQNYTNSYQQYIVSANALAKGSVGGIALNWGPPHNSKLMSFWKMTHCYRGEFKPFVNPPYSETGFDRLACVDAVAALYGGSVSSNPCPQIVTPADGDLQGIECDFKATLTSAGRAVAPNESLTAAVTATDPTDALTFDWYLVGGTAEGFSGNIDGAQTDPQNYINTTTLRLGGGTTTNPSAGTYRNSITFNARNVTGNNYQLRVIVRDGQGGAATAVVGFAMQP